MVNMMNSPEMERIGYWFQHAHELCSKHECEDCSLVGYQPMQTDVSVLRCETGKDRKPKGQENDEGSGSQDNGTDQN